MDVPPVVKGEDGKAKFIGQDDPSNPPVFVKNPSMRYCPSCHKESENNYAVCKFCNAQFTDGKMECPVCHNYFDYLIGETANGGRQGCEADWLPPKKHVEEAHEPITKADFE